MRKLRRAFRVVTNRLLALFIDISHEFYVFSTTLPNISNSHIHVFIRLFAFATSMRLATPPKRPLSYLSRYVESISPHGALFNSILSLDYVISACFHVTSSPSLPFWARSIRWIWKPDSLSPSICEFAMAFNKLCGVRFSLRRQ